MGTLNSFLLPLAGAVSLAAGIGIGQRFNRLPHSDSALSSSRVVDLRMFDEVMAYPDQRQRMSTAIPGVMGAWEDSSKAAEVARTLRFSDRDRWRDASLVRVLGELAFHECVCGLNGSPSIAVGSTGTRRVVVWKNWNRQLAAWIDLDTADGLSRWMLLDTDACRREDPTWERWTSAASEGRR